MGEYNNPTNKQDLEATIGELEAKLADLKARLPAHSIPPSMIAEMDDIDEQLAKMREHLAGSRPPRDK
jgi:hypothetical protein